MAASVEDIDHVIANGSSHTMQTLNGIPQQVSRMARVIGLTPGVGAPFEATAAQALPTIGSPHPNSNDLILEDYSVTMDGGDAAMVECIYRWQDPGTWQTPDGENPTQPKWQGGVAVEQVTLYKGADDKALAVTYTPAGQDETVTTPVTMIVTEPRAALTVPIMMETKFPGAIALQWVGRVNSAMWNGGSAREWMCTSTPFTLIDNSTSPPKWEFTFEFVHNRDTHDPQGVVTDPATGFPIEDWKTLKAFLRLKDHYPLKDFNTLFPGA
jgi:hypothetical protein